MVYLNIKGKMIICFMVIYPMKANSTVVISLIIKNQVSDNQQVKVLFIKETGIIIIIRLKD